jgi:protein-L-isoaspartate(D-aspartate) O-methyltransferase
MTDYTLRREGMVRDQIAARGVSDDRVLAAMRRVPRHEFVPEHLRHQAYGDHALPIGGGQTISQPFIVARMSELLKVEPTSSVLEIGTGSGYQTAILAHLARRVFSLERVPELARQAIERMRHLKLDNVKVQVFDGTLGWKDMGPFDRILVTAGAPKVPEPLLDQLALGGRLVIPEGDRQRQKLVLYERSKRGIRRSEGEPVAFVPLIGKHGWDRES